jgi:hypothetical protein
MDIPESSKYKPISADEAIGQIRKKIVIQNRKIINFGEVLKQLESDDFKEIFSVTISDCQISKFVRHPEQIKKSLNISLSVFNQEVDFYNSTFEKPIQFCVVTFIDRAVFAKAKFTGPSIFNGSKFLEKASFGQASFKDDTYFLDCFFKKNIILRGAKINAKLSFEGAKFEGKLDLRDIVLLPGGKVLLTINEIGKYQRPTWLDQWLIKMDFVRRRWPSVCLLEGEDSKDKGELKYAADQYNMLRDNFRALPSKDEEEYRCHYKYKDLTRRATQKHYLWQFWDWAVMKWCLGYGIYTKRIFFTALGVILGFGILYHFAGGDRLIRNFDTEFNPLYFSAITFTTIGYGDYAPLGWLRFLAGLEGLLGMILVAVFTVSFARKLIR